MRHHPEHSVAGTAELLAAIRRQRIVDLSHPLHDAMPIFPGRNVLPFERRQTARLAEHGVSAGRISMGEHQGTHLDAPCHFVADGLTADRIPVEHLVVEAVLIDVEAAAAADPDHLLSTAEILAWEAAHGPIPYGSYVLIRSGWGRRWSDPAGFVGADEAGVLHYPAVSADAAQALVDRGVLGVGVETLSVDNASPSPVRSPAHKVLHGAGRYVIENLARLNELPAHGIVLILGALPVRDGTAGPARILALVEDPR